MTDAYDAARLADLDRRIDGWLAELADEHDHIIAIDRTMTTTIRRTMLLM